MNVVCIVGRLTADPELKTTTSGISVSSFSVAVQSSNKNADGTYKTDFINCVAWRNTAEFLTKYFKKGQMIGLNGAIQTRQYQDKDTGKNRTAFEVIANNLHFVESKNGGANPGATERTPAAVTATAGNFSELAPDDGDLPF